MSVPNNDDDMLSDSQNNGLPPAYSATVMTNEDDNVDQKGPKEEVPIVANKKKVSYIQLFRYADCWDAIAMIIGILLALGRGAALPASFLFYAKILNALMTYSPCWDKLRAKMALLRNQTMGNSTTTMMMMGGNATASATDEQMKAAEHYLSLKNNNPLFDEVNPVCIDYAMVGVGMFVAGILHCTLWTIAGERQIQRIRTKLFRAMLTKDAGWFDARRSGALNAVLFDQIRKMEDGMTTNVSLTAFFIGTAISGFIIAFVLDWLVSIVIFTFVPLLFAVGFTMIRIVRTYSAKQAKAYQLAGSVANEVLGNSRTVLAFNKQEYEVRRYGGSLTESMRFGTIKTITAGVAQGLGFLIFNGMSGLAFWWGNSDHVSQAGGNVMTIIFSMMIGTAGLANASPNFEILATAAGAAEEVFGIIDEESKIDNFSTAGRRLESVTGNISFQDVAFAYPSRPDRNILKNFNLDVLHGQTVALVGPSGCGKSTTAQMLMRFYDAIAGKVTLDGVDIREFDVRWLRHNIGLVSQEPVLFNTTIKENIRLGALDRPEVPDEDIFAACRLSNAHNFISALPEGYNTMVGERGAQLSGGQKQRIAIARALISNPKILVLDEATSALDTTSEKVVQEALDNARVGRTTLVIAHRLSTIRNADKIAVIDGGVVAELGNHHSLMNQRGLYYRLVRKQELVEAEEAKARGDGTEATAEIDEDEDGSERVVEVNELDEAKGGSTRSSKRRETGVSRRSANRAVSVHEAEVGGENEAEGREPGRWELMKVVLTWGRPELVYTICCCFIATIAGGVQPSFAIIMSEFAGSFCPGDTQDKFKQLIGASVALGCAHSMLMACEHWIFSVIGERLTKRVRCMLLGKLLRMDAAWLDKQEHQPSVLTTILATDCTDIRGISGIRINLYLTTGVMLLIGIIYSLIMDYRLALAMTGLLPFIIIASFIQARYIMQAGRLDAGAAKDTSILAMDAISNIRTVMSLGAENYFLNRFDRRFDELTIGTIKSGIFTSPMLAFPSSSFLWSGAITFCLGAWLMERGETTFLNVFRIYILIMMVGMSVGRQTSAVPDESLARKSTKKLLDILNHKILIDREDPVTGESIGYAELNEHKELLAKPCMGRIEFKNVTFAYPNRPAIQVLKNVSFTVEPGQRVALCGTSGGGKSTIMQLIQRLYDPNSGSVLIDGVNIRKSNIRLIRSQIGLVSQEPVLFALTIGENIDYGTRIQDEKPTKDQVDQVCQQANVHGFVKKLPERFDTFVGERGAQLSGGQKQRIAIARALVRNPSILLLDEATSALDTESERIVQDAIEMASHGRTSLTIAHRLSTIQNSDKILVLDNGMVAEEGTHAELMAKQGIYYDLQLAQVKAPVQQRKKGH